MPPDPPREVPPSAVALSVPKKNPTFSQILIGSTESTFKGARANLKTTF